MKIISDRAVVRGEYFKLMSLREKFPRGLTFYKDFTRIPAGEYAGAANIKLLYADFAMGSPVATFTSTSGNFTITSSGYQATTANDDVLKYLIAGNRTAAQETIVIKFTPTGDFANDGVDRYILSNDTKNRVIYKWSGGNKVVFYPNVTDSSGTTKYTSTVPLSGVSYVVAMVCKSSNDPNLRIFVKGVQESTDDDDDFTANTWGDYFYIGSSNSGGLQLNGFVSSIFSFNRDLSIAEVSIATNLMP